MRSFRLFLLVWVSFAAGLAHGLTDYEAAIEAFRKEVEVGPALSLSEEFLPELRELIELPIGEVYDQGNTQWCWAYSMFHSMRAYYLHTQEQDEGVATWKPAISAFSTHGDFTQFMRKHFSTGTTGNPINFVRAMRRYSSPPLPDPGWTVYVPTSGSVRLTQDHDLDPDLRDRSATRIPLQKIAEKIQESLSTGVAVAYCYPPHCVSIYGAVLENGKAKEYLIADSAGGRKYRAIASKALAKLDLITTRR